MSGHDTLIVILFLGSGYTATRPQMQTRARVQRDSAMQHSRVQRLVLVSRVVRGDLHLPRCASDRIIACDHPARSRQHGNAGISSRLARVRCFGISHRSRKIPSALTGKFYGKLPCSANLIS